MFVNHEETETPVGAQLAARIQDVGSAEANLGVGGLKFALQRGVGIALAALFLVAPGATLAANECEPVGIDPSANLGLADSYDCDDTSYGSGVIYTADGDLAVDFTVADGVTDVGDAGVDLGGINLTASGTDSIVFDSATTNTEIESDTVTGPVLNVITENGNIDIDTEELDADGQTPGGVTHGIYAQSTGGGNVDVTTTANIDVDSGSNSDSSIGIEARSGSGNVTVTTNGDVLAKQHGILAETGGAGTLTITAAGQVRLPLFDDTGMGAIDATTGTGLLTIDIAAGSGQINGGGSDSAVIRANAGGDVIVNIGSGRSVNKNFGGSENPMLDLTAAGQITVNNAGLINAGNDLAIQPTASALLLNNNDGGEIRGQLDFSGLTDGYVFNNNAGAIWDADLQSGTQAADLDVAEPGTGELNNAGTIEMKRGQFISAHGMVFTGSGDGRLTMFNSVLDGNGQSDCNAPTVTGCLDLTGGSSAGQTEVLIRTSVNAPSGPPFLKALDNPVSPGVVVVDVGGGTSQADHFVLSPDSFAFSDSGNVDIYAEDPVYDAVLKTGGLFDYALLYNPNTQQHLLASVPQHEALEYAAFIHESLSVWHTTSDAVAGRQADLRDGGQRGGWVRVLNENTDRDFRPKVTTHGNTFIYDRSYSLETRAIIAGYDLTTDDNHVFGLHLGFMGTRLDHDDSPTSDEAEFLDGASSTFGVYAGWWNDAGLTLDGTLNVNLLDIRHDVRSDLEDTRTNVLTTGIRAEAGWRFPISEAFYVQPLVTASYATADIENLDIRDYDAKFEDTESQRAALGVRLGGGMDLGNNQFNRLKYWLTARAWEEYAEDGNVQFAVEGGDPLVIEDDISESFEEVGLGVSLASPDENLEVFLSGNVRSGDHTDGNNVTVGARLNW